MSKADDVATIDALVDLVYVAVGWALTMGWRIAETYARAPGFYGITYSVAEFDWEPFGGVVGS